MYRRLFRHPEKISFLQCFRSKRSRAQRAWAADVADDIASGLHSAMQVEPMKQKGYFITESALAGPLLVAFINSKELALVHTDRSWYTSWVLDINAALQSF